MSPLSPHLGETLQDLLDGRLDSAARAQAEAHLAGCAACREELEELRSAKQALRRAAAVDLPPDLAAAVSRALDGQAAARPARRWLSPRPAFALGLLLLVALTAAALLWRSRSTAVSAAIARAYVDYRDHRMPLELRTTDTAEMERFFAAHQVPFPTHVYDLGMMGFRLVGGRVHVFDARTGALFAYQGAGGIALLCDMYIGTLEELPNPVETRDHDGIRFDVHRRDGLTMVFWEEGEVVCVLMSEMPAEEVIQLAFAKAMKPRVANVQAP
jgi:anti-sigma factor RsiW